MLHTSKPVVISTVAQFQALRATLQGSVGFVPTMGALHAGHAALLKQSRAENVHSVLSIFVNPTQFGPKEDLSKYPRTFERDLEIAASEGVGFVFAPTNEEIYPDGYSTFVEENTVSAPLCGPFRPGHFRGVTTVVLKLFNTVQPAHAYFGMKDAQQFFVLQKMCRDLNLSVQLTGVPTVREGDGLALSSRNVYLSAEQREKAPLLYKTLCATRDAILQNSSTTSHIEILAKSKQALESADFQVQYLDHLSVPTLQAITQPNQPAIIAVAAYLGTTRLIDNVILN